MSYHNGPKIVKDELKLCLDAGCKKSFDGTSTTWKNLASSNNATLVNGLGYDGESIIYSANDDYITTSAFTDCPNLPLSVFAWVYPTSLTTNQSAGIYYNWIANQRTVAAVGNWQLLFRSGLLAASVYYNSGASFTTSNGTTSFDLNKWYYVGFSTDGTSGGFLRTYINGVLEDETTLLGDRSVNNDVIIIGRAGWQANFLPFRGNYAALHVYNKALSEKEVRQNYNALKGRFGL